MQDDRLAGVGGELEVAPQVGQLIRDGAEDAVVVEPGLPDGEDPILGRPAGDPPPAGIIDLCCVMRMDPDGDVDPGHTFRQAPRALARRDIPAGDEDALDTAGTGRVDRGFRVVGETVGIDVAMGVDQAQGQASDPVSASCVSAAAVAASTASASSRGNNGSGVPTRPASLARAPHSNSPRIDVSPFPSGP